MDAEQIVTILVAIASSSAFGGIINAIWNVRKATKAEVAKLREDLDTCKINCQQLKLTVENWQFRFNQREAELDRMRKDRDEWRDRWMNEIGR